MATPDIGRKLRGPRMTTFHTGAIVIAILSGSYALVALLVGSPLEFGVALALCGACWVAAHFIEWTVERERAARGGIVLAAPLNSGYGSSHAVFVGAGEYFARRAPRAERGSCRAGFAFLEQIH